LRADDHEWRAEQPSLFVKRDCAKERERKRAQEKARKKKRGENRLQPF
jgi:hypothetical protein